MKTALLFSMFATAVSFSQGLDPAVLAKPAKETWGTYNGDYSGRRYSPLSQINSTNVSSMTLAWAYQGHTVAIKSTRLK